MTVRTDRPPLATPLLIAAAAVPALLAFNLPPSPTFFNQAAAFAVWGAAVAAIAWLTPPGTVMDRRATAPLQWALLLCLLPVIASWLFGYLPGGLALSSAASVLAAMVLVAGGAAAAASPDAQRLLHGFFFAWLIAGVASASIGLLQVFMPEWPDGEWIARSGLAGRAVGNLRQPNHLSSLLLWATIAVIPLFDEGRLKRGGAITLFALFVFGVELSGSRTGAVGVAVLALWGALDRRLTRGPRALLLSAPLWYGLFWLLMAWWSRETHGSFGAAAHVTGSDPSSSRFAIWSNTLALIARHPWAGVGFGEFNFAWSLTPFPGRPTAFFDHTHNLPLQLMGELGIPLGGAVVVLLALALWQAFRRTWTHGGARGVAGRSAFVMVLLMALHSQLEYPLWYAYFLLPAAWAWGYSLAQPMARESAAGPWQRRLLLASGLAMIIASLWSVAQYMTIARIFEPGNDTTPLEHRIVQGQRTVLFAHHADYAAATTADQPSNAWSAFRRAPHYLLDTRLMIAWANALAEKGDLDRARHIAQRLREFRNSASEEFFAPCRQPVASMPLPFQCSPPSRAIDWREFRDLH
jgi:O-antigen ligase